STWTILSRRIPPLVSVAASTAPSTRSSPLGSWAAGIGGRSSLLLHPYAETDRAHHKPKRSVRVRTDRTLLRERRGIALGEGRVERSGRRGGRQVLAAFLLRRAEGRALAALVGVDAAVAHRDHARHRHREGVVVRDDDDRRAVLLVDLEEEVVHRAARLRVEV